MTVALLSVMRPQFTGDLDTLVTFCCQSFDSVVQKQK